MWVKCLNADTAYAAARVFVFIMRCVGVGSTRDAHGGVAMLGGEGTEPVSGSPRRHNETIRVDLGSGITERCSFTATPQLLFRPLCQNVIARPNCQCHARERWVTGCGGRDDTITT
jgi:hypothetical protein